MDNTLIQPMMTWIKQIPGEIFKLDETPLLGYSSPFPWIDFAKQIETSLNLEGITLTAAAWRWRSQKELFDGLGDNFKSIPLTVSPIEGLVYWIMPVHGIAQLMSRLLANRDDFNEVTIDAEFRETFYRFITHEIVNIFEKICSEQKLSVSLSDRESFPADSCLCQDIEISYQGTTVHGRLFLTPEFRKSWMNRFLQEREKNIYAGPLAEKLNVIINLEAGRVSLKPSEWNKICIGDLILLDSCSLDPDEDKGRIQLVINGISFFRAKIKQGSIKILEHPLYHEVDTPMANPPKNNDDSEDVFDDSELDAEIDSEIEGENNHSMQEESELSEISEMESDIESETESQLESEIESEIEPSEYTDTDSKSDFDMNERSGIKELTPKTPSSQSKPSALKGAGLTTPSPSKSSKAAIEEIPLNIVVEVGRLQISIKKLLELQPGNMLDLNIHPEAGVDLVLNGKLIAKGELLRIGDTLGVRIIDLT